MLVILPQLGGSRRPKRILSDRLYTLVVTQDETGAWACLVVGNEFIEESDLAFDEIARNEPLGGWVLALEEYVMLWGGRIPGHGHVDSIWRPLFLYKTGSGEELKADLNEIDSFGAHEAVCDVVESQIIPGRSFPMADRLKGVPVRNEPDLRWGMSGYLSSGFVRASCSVLFLVCLIGAPSVVGLVVSTVVIPTRPTMA